jgi:hypothetical protein
VRPRDPWSGVLARARLWVPLAVVAAVPVGVLASGGDGAARPASATTLAAAGVRAGSTTTPDLGGVGDALCPVLPAASCTDSGSGGDAAGGDTSPGGPAASAAPTTTSGRGLPAPPQGACEVVPLPRVCSSSTSSTVTVAPPRTRRSHTTTTRTRTSTSTATATTSTTTVTVTVTQSQGQSQASRSTGATPTTSTRTGTT